MVSAAWRAAEGFAGFPNLSGGERVAANSFHGRYADRYHSRKRGELLGSCGWGGSPIPSANWLANDATGTYAANEWFQFVPGIGGGVGIALPADLSFPFASSVRSPVSTPLFSDSTWPVICPLTNDLSPEDLFTGSPPLENVLGFKTGTIPIGVATIARHGSRPPAAAPQSQNPSSPLPRAWGVNVSFEDGHAALVKLPDLWTLTWNRAWVSENQPGVP